MLILKKKRKNRMQLKSSGTKKVFFSYLLNCQDYFKTFIKR